MPATSPEARGGLFVVSGPGGVGKGTVVARVADRLDDVVVAVSATTREPRPGEVDGRHYHFLTEEEFDALVDADGFLEWAAFAGRRYGTPWSSIVDPLAAGRKVLLEIEVQGALQVRERRPEAVLIFLTPPTPETLRERLRARGTDDDERIEQRMAIARWELAQAAAFDHVVVNDELDRATGAIARILSS